ncbi:MAG: hypothetical protein DHS20C19_04490 [Acidimicrobiales bacterium]|nr:MAG: hypothetical protein DHS20C19_04490 [Acidimicrobiales bacterium]
MTVLAIAAIFATACGDDGGGSADATTTTGPTSSTTEAPPSGDTTTTTTTTTEPPATTTTTEAPDDELPDEIERVDYLTFAQGANPFGFSVEGPGKGLKNSVVMQAIDGSTTPRAFVSGATDETAITMVFELAAPTTFDRFAVPEVGEVPSPGTTFFREIEVAGADDAGGPFETLAAATLATHEGRGEVTELNLVDERSVRYLQIRLAGGIEILTEESGFEFSELIANGTQEPPEFSEGFTGIWDAKLPDIDRSVGFIELTQSGVVVTGCFGLVDLTGTVTGNLVRLSGIHRDSLTSSAYIFGLDADGQLQGVASSNGGPFSFMPSSIAPEGTTTDCSDIPEPETPPLACGSVIHGINFDVNSATLRADSAPVLAQLFDGLVADDAASIVVEGHTSTEGSDAYNLDLSDRRAQSVVDDLVARGIDPGRISAIGFGESEPLISPDNDEASRSINRRVEIDCS